MTLVLVAWFVPSCPGDAGASGRRELSAFKVPQVWLTLLAGAVGFGGMFAVYTYIAPVVTDVAGLAERRSRSSCSPSGSAWSPAPGWRASWPTGRSSARCSSGRSAWPRRCWPSGSPRPTAGPRCPSSSSSPLGSVLVVNLQLRLMDVAGDAQTLGAAMNHASLNIANALGAWLGGLVIAAGCGLRAPALVGLALSIAGVAILLLSAALHGRQRGRRTPIVTCLARSDQAFDAFSDDVAWCPRARRRFA